MEPLLERKVLGDGQRRARREQPLDRGIFGDVEEEDRSLERRALGEARAEESGLTLGHAHRGEDDDELVGSAAPGHGRLRRDLRCELGGREAEAGEDGQLLPSHERVQTVDRRDPGLDELVRMVAGDGVDRRPVDVAVCVGLHRGPTVDGTAGAVEDAEDQIEPDCGAGHLAAGADARVGQVQAGGAGQHLDHDPVPFDREHLATPDGSVRRDHVDELVVAHPLWRSRAGRRSSSRSICLTARDCPRSSRPPSSGSPRKR